MVQKLVYRYSRAFQQQVVDDLEEGRFHSLNQAKEHYGIRGDGTIHRSVLRNARQDLLEQALGRTQADRVLNEAFLELACEELGQDVEAFKKKVDIEESIRPKKDPEKA